MEFQPSQQRTTHKLAEAESLFASNRLSEAEDEYREISKEGQHAPEACLRLGEISLKQGQVFAAIQRYRNAVALRPNWSKAHSELGKALLVFQKPDEAVASFLQAIEIDPQNQEARITLARFYKSTGFWREAARHYAELIPHCASDSWVFQEFGFCCQELGDFALAEKALEKANQLGVETAVLLFNLGTVRLRLGHIRDAIDCFQKALTKDPLLPLANLALAKAYRQSGNIDAAEATLRRELVVNGTCSDALLHLGLVLQSKRRIAEAIECYKQAIKRNPFHPVLQQNYAIVALLATDFQARRNNDDRFSFTRYLPNPGFERPHWDGTDLANRTILLRSDENPADTVALIRYIPRIASPNSRVIVQCPSVLKRLIASIPSVSDVIHPETPIPQFDVHATLHELPHSIGSVLDADESEWKPHIDPTGFSVPEIKWNQNASVRVGLAWAETRKTSVFSETPMDSDVWEPVLNVEGCEFFFLQSHDTRKPNAVSQARGTTHGFPIRFPDFADLAGVIRQLDLVISVDSPAAHIAACMGHSVWMILPYSADWRWLLRRGDFPWYPTMTLFREPRPGDRKVTMVEVARNLSTLASRVSK